jgi:UDP-sulfoquinovose synthase
VYGYDSMGEMELPEGYLRCRVGNTEFDMMYPASPGSIYHMTKCMDALMFQFYNKNDGLLITDLHQGIVWGTQTPETAMDERLINRFDYDGDYGTVLNRFLMQAAVGHPLTVYGTGGQQRAFIHITDTVECIRMAIAEPPKAGERVRIINQVSEQLTLIDLAEQVRELTGARIQHCHNPRLEASSNTLRMSNRTLLRMGLRPTLVADKLLEEVVEIAGRYKDRCDTSKIQCRSVWRTGMRIGEIASDEELEISCKTT